MKIYKIISLLILVFIGLGFLYFTHTADAALVTCDTSENPKACTVCDLVALAKRIIDFVLFELAPAIAVLLYLWAGFTILLGSTPLKIGEGKTIFWNTTVGLVIMFSAWMITNTILKSLAADSDVADAWYKIECRESGRAQIQPPAPAGIPVAPAVGATLCSNPAMLAQQYGARYPRGNSAQLSQLKDCVNTKIGSLIDQSQEYTFEITNDLCNYNRGNNVCGACTHAVDSCHYGGNSGANGAEAIDFNAKFAVVTERQLYAALQKIQVACNFGSILFENDHTHVSTKNCIGN